MEIQDHFDLIPITDLTQGTDAMDIEDDTPPGRVQKRTIVYEAPFTKCDREADYEQAWGANRTGGVMQ